MDKQEMLLKLLAQSGWVVTNTVDQSGSKVVIAK